MASALVRERPACARSRTACPISVGTSVITPTLAPLAARVSNPPAASPAGFKKNFAPTTVRIESSAACGIAASAAAPSLTSVLSPWSIASFWRSRFEPKNKGNPAAKPPTAAPTRAPGMAPTPKKAEPAAAPAAAPAATAPI